MSSLWSLLPVKTLPPLTAVFVIVAEETPEFPPGFDGNGTLASAQLAVTPCAPSTARMRSSDRSTSNRKVSPSVILSAPMRTAFVVACAVEIEPGGAFDEAGAAFFGFGGGGFAVIFTAGA
jgi:hypothetical protein